jgi:hypothetical protein
MNLNSLRAGFCPPHIWSKMVVFLLALCLLTGLSVQVAQAAPPADGPTYHYVRRGETLASIGRRYGVSYWAIAQANGISNPNLIYAGQRLVIPGGGWPQPYPYHAYTYGYGYRPYYGYSYSYPYYYPSYYYNWGWYYPYYPYYPYCYYDP